VKDSHLFTAAAFVAILAFHGVWSINQPAACDGSSCAPGAVGCDTGTADTSTLSGAIGAYVANGDIWLGLSYALAGAFCVYALSLWSENRKRAATGALAGLTIGSALAVFGCFLVGCCGSPMLPVWLGLFGGKALGLTKPLMAALTLVSVAIGYALLKRGCGAGCACGSSGCGPEEPS
jgi:hypothetical protein